MSVDDFQALVRRHRDRIFNLALSSLRHREDAEDVTQEVLIRLWHHRRKLEGPSVAAWVVKVTRNACYDLMRRHGARKKRVDELDDPATLDQVVAESPGPHHHAEAADFRSRLAVALRGLPEKYRTILVLREIEGLKYDEIAELTERPLSSVKVNLHRGRKMLRDELRALHPDPAHRADGALPTETALRTEMAEASETALGPSPIDAPLASRARSGQRAAGPPERGDAGREAAASQLREVTAHA